MLRPKRPKEKRDSDKREETTTQKWTFFFFQYTFMISDLNISNNDIYKYTRRIIPNV